MVLAEITDQVRRLSGRYDLSREELLHLVRAGQRLLDEMHSDGVAVQQLLFPIEKPAQALPMPLLRHCCDVFVGDGATRTQLRAVQAREIEQMLLMPPNEIPPSIPKCWAVTSTRMAPGVYATHLPAVPATWADYSASDDSPIILQLYPPARSGLILEIHGKWYTPELVTDTDQNYWSINHPLLLIWAALYHNEVGLRNSEGAQDWLAAISDRMLRLNFENFRLAEVYHEIQG